MIVDTLVIDTLPKLAGQHICIFGADKCAKDLVQHISEQDLNITVKFLLDTGPTREIWGLPVYNFKQYTKQHSLADETIVIATGEIMDIQSKEFIDVQPAKLYLFSTAIKNLFLDEGEKWQPSTIPFEKANRAILPFTMKNPIPPVPVIVLNGYVEDGKSVYEIADFMQQHFDTYTCEIPKIPISLYDFSTVCSVDNLSMRVSHLDYLMWKRTMHVVQLSPSRRFLVASRYNFFHLDIIDRKTDEVTHWHNRDASEGLWFYTATGDFDDDDHFYFARWTFKDVLAGMSDGTNQVRCQVCRLHLLTMRAETLHEFMFYDMIHQVTISGDGRYMVFAPMRKQRLKKNVSDLREDDVMRCLQEWAVLDYMATLDMQTGQISFTRIPYPVPAHFELDPKIPHLFYVSTHSLVPHMDGVLVFNPGTIHKIRITEGQSAIEGTYSHPQFVRTIQHCSFLHRGKTLLAATNQNKLEIINASDMSRWHIHKLLDDPFYDNADFSNQNFMSRPFSLPMQAQHCNSIATDIYGEHLILTMNDSFLIYNVGNRQILGSVPFRCSSPIGHSRFYMQNALIGVAKKRWSELYPLKDTKD
ncbi:MAG: hypothetical protein LBR26_01555 [Prevotella sp.]|jgi:hypothetical protein|nr:hypothetical protein [Prevotella sp.]